MAHSNAAPTQRHGHPLSNPTAFFPSLPPKIRTNNPQRLSSRSSMSRQIGRDDDEL
jgi:hypothetical protein